MVKENDEDFDDLKYKKTWNFTEYYLHNDSRKHFS